MEKTKAAVRYLVLLAVAAGLLWLSFRGIDWRATFAEFESINYGWLGISIFVSVIAFFSRARRWNLLIEPLGHAPGIFRTINALMIGYLANLAIPRLGEVTRCGTLSRSAHVPFNILLGTVIVERVLDVICLSACLFLTAWIEHDRLGHFMSVNIFHPIQHKIASMSLMTLLLLLGVFSITVITTILVVRKRSQVPVATDGKFAQLIKGILQGLRSIRTIERKGEFIFHTVLIWFLYFLMSYTCFKALPATAGLSWQAGLFVLVVGGMGMSAPVQGGIGAYHLLVSRGLLLYGMTAVHGLAFATLMHTSQTLLIIIMGTIAFILVSMGSVTKKANETP